MRSVITFSGIRGPTGLHHRSLPPSLVVQGRSGASAARTEFCVEQASYLSTTDVFDLCISSRGWRVSTPRRWIARLLAVSRSV